MDDDVEAETKRLSSFYGELMFQRFMEFLLNEEYSERIWKNESSCCKCKKAAATAAAKDFAPGAGRKKRKTLPELKNCITPVGAVRQGLHNRGRLRVASAGTVCVDMSQMGVRSPTQLAHGL